MSQNISLILSLFINFRLVSMAAEARREASRDGVPPIELIDGEKLVDMMEKLELGLKPVMAYEIDEAFFQQFRG